MELFFVLLVASPFYSASVPLFSVPFSLSTPWVMAPPPIITLKDPSGRYIALYCRDLGVQSIMFFCPRQCHSLRLPFLWRPVGNPTSGPWEKRYTLDMLLSLYGGFPSRLECWVFSHASASFLSLFPEHIISFLRPRLSVITIFPFSDVPIFFFVDRSQR